jgi:uncharacterized protein YyaL (SSP411 family)
VRRRDDVYRDRRRNHDGRTSARFAVERVRPPSPDCSGAFARYSVDERWAVPHFEKMLYDNGQLVKLYADAYRLTGNRKWKRVFEETIAYVLRDMTHPEGGFYASEDADSEGEEGKFYVWTPAEVKAVLGDTDGATACRAYGVTERGNFEHGVSCNAHEMSLMAGLVTLCDSVISSNLGE